MPDFPRDLVETFRQGQEAVLAALEQIFADVRNFSKARQGLPGLEERLLAHFYFQQEKIYPALGRFFLGSREFTKKLEFLQHEIKDIKVQLIIFLDKYSGNTSSVVARSFPVEFSALRKSIIDRVHSEEDLLLPYWAQYEQGRVNKS